MRTSSFRGVVDVVFGGEKPVEEKEEGPKGKKKGKMVQNGKRKAEEEGVEKVAEKEVEKLPSKRELKRRAKKARLEGAEEDGDGKDASVKKATNAKGNGNGNGDVPMADAVGSIPLPTTTGTLTDVIKEQEQSQGPDGALDAGDAADAAGDPIVPAITAELGFAGTATEVVSIWFRAPAVTTDWELIGAGYYYCERQGDPVQGDGYALVLVSASNIGQKEEIRYIQELPESEPPHRGSLLDDGTEKGCCSETKYIGVPREKNANIRARMSKYDPQPSHINYTTVTGYFLQDEPSTNPSSFNFTAANFGLINRTYATDPTYDPSGKKTQWQRFANQIFRLNRDALHGTQYKVLYMGRHGEGYHNAAESYYGTPAWNCYYSELDGNGTVTWADADLTSKGVAQALAVNAFWASEIRDQKIPRPQSYYASPLTRCLTTANLTFNGLDLASRQPFVPTVKEFLREGISGHTCDRRGSKSYIQSAFPSYKIEAGFTETDQLWEAYHGETRVDQDIRSKAVLDDIFSHDHETYISITSHSGEIASILRVQNPNDYPLSAQFATAFNSSTDSPRSVALPFGRQKYSAEFSIPVISLTKRDLLDVFTARCKGQKLYQQMQDAYAEYARDNTKKGLEFGQHDIDSGWTRTNLASAGLETRWDKPFLEKIAKEQGKTSAELDRYFVKLKQDKTFRTDKGRFRRPSHEGIQGNKRRRGEEQRPPMNRLSDSIWTVWLLLTRRRAYRLRYLGRDNIVNPDTKMVIQRISDVAKQTHHVPWPGLTYGMDDDVIRGWASEPKAG
ncbi:MAG: hypothetical protein Q9181_007317 [Wetmoreana brouardii]